MPKVDRNQSAAYRPDIDGLRAIAVMCVATFHYLPRLAPGGFVGVDVFFVISGFLISGIILKSLESNVFSYRDFYSRRIRRIFPALLLVMAAYLVVGWFSLTPREYFQAGADIVAATGFASNLLLWSQSGYFNHAAQTKPFLHLWSLGIEEQFYLVWPFCLVWLRREPARVMALAGLSFAANIVLMSYQPTAAFYLPVSRFWELLLGALLAQISHLESPAGLAGRACRFVRSLQRSSSGRDVASILGLMLIGAAALGLSGKVPFPGFWALLPVCGAVLIIAAGPEAVVNRSVLSTPSMILIGLISYPIYLWHWPILALLRKVDPSLLPPEARSVRLGGLVLSACLAYASYRFVEVRVRHARDATRPLCVLMIAFLLAGLLIMATGGAQARWGEAQNRLEDQAERSRASSSADWRGGTCFLSWTGRALFDPECGDAFVSGTPSVLLWGDSHAAQLYPALSLVLPGRGLSLAQMTAPSCPPLFDYDAGSDPRCPAITQLVFDWAAIHQPRTVILAATWSETEHYERVEVTIRRLRSAGVKNVIVVGSVARFSHPQPASLLRHSSKDFLLERIPNKLLPELRRVDAVLREICERAGAQFVAPLEKTCDSTDCIVALRGSPDLLLSFDEAHLTRAGSNFVVGEVLCKDSVACDRIE